MLTSARLLSLLLSLSHLLLLYISSLTLIRGTVILRSSSWFKHSFKRFHPSLSFSHTHTQSSLPYAQNCTFSAFAPSMHHQKSWGLTRSWKCVCQACCLEQARVSHRLQPSVVAHKHTNTQKYTKIVTNGWARVHTSTQIHLFNFLHLTASLSVLMLSVDCTQYIDTIKKPIGKIYR